MTTFDYAEQTPAGWRATCPVAEREYLSLTAREQHVGEHHFVWLTCACCDAHRHIAPAPLDLAEPQFHPYVVRP